MGGINGKRYRGRKKKLSKNEKPQGIYELLGIALGCIGLSYEDFCRLDFQEFSSVYESYAAQRDMSYKDDWNRMRILASIMVQPYLDKGKNLTPEQLLPFPWDEKTKKRKRPKLSKEEENKRFEALVKKCQEWDKHK